MTKEEAKQSSNDKIKTITALLKQMEITISAEQMITDQGFIKNMVYYTDNEKYDIDEESVEPVNVTVPATPFVGGDLVDEKEKEDEKK